MDGRYSTQSPAPNSPDLGIQRPAGGQPAALAFQHVVARRAGNAAEGGTDDDDHVIGHAGQLT